MRIGMMPSTITPADAPIFSTKSSFASQASSFVMFAEKIAAVFAAPLAAFPIASSASLQVEMPR